MRIGTIAILTVALTAGVPLPAAPQENVSSREAICLMIEAAAWANGLPLDFFARLIWQESRFNAAVVGPLTRSGRRAQGIAQFMPGTAAERGLLDPFDPVQALPESAEFLRELRAAFGNLGLAAAAYNAGPRRVREWLAGAGPMPAETRSYVLAITGHPVDDWIDAKDSWTPAGAQSCGELIALVKHGPNTYLTALEQRVRQGIARPWGVQIAANFSRDRALAAYARAMRRHAAALGERDPLILSGLHRSRGTRPLYQVRIGADSRAEADKLCTRIRSAGGACLVLRNRGKSGSG
jgi:soluble lytic murein transglycosylase-like protein